MTTLSTAALMNRSGATYRQVDYWCRLGFFGPELATPLGSGHARSFGPDAVRMARVLTAVSAVVSTGGQGAVLPAVAEAVENTDAAPWLVVGASGPVCGADLPSLLAAVGGAGIVVALDRDPADAMGASA
jgi:hypothetical protein